MPNIVETTNLGVSIVVIIVFIVGNGLKSFPG